MTRPPVRADVRLHLRLTTRCNSGCGHCTIADLAPFGEPDLARALRDLETARREHGATEVVFMRGEPTLLPSLPKLARTARRLGYTHVQLQTNGRLLAYEHVLDRLLAAGVTFFEVSLFGPSPEVHDAADGCPGAFAEVAAALRHLAARDVPFLVTIPVLRANLGWLRPTVLVARDLGAPRIQLGFPRPTSRPDGTSSLPLLPSLAEAAPHVRSALALARRLSLPASTEAFPLCLLDPEDRAATDAAVEFSRHLVSDLPHPSLARLSDLRASLRSKPPACAPCRLRETCPGPWSAYVAAFGDGELVPVG